MIKEMFKMFLTLIMILCLVPLLIIPAILIIFIITHESIWKNKTVEINIE